MTGGSANRHEEMQRVGIQFKEKTGTFQFDENSSSRNVPAVSSNSKLMSCIFPYPYLTLLESGELHSLHLQTLPQLESSVTLTLHLYLRICICTQNTTSGPTIIVTYHHHHHKHHHHHLGRTEFLN